MHQEATFERAVGYDGRSGVRSQHIRRGGGQTSLGGPRRRYREALGTHGSHRQTTSGTGKPANFLSMK